MLKPENAFVLVIDVQGKLAEIVRKPDRLKRNVARLIEAARLFDLPLVVTEQVPEKLGATAPDLVEVLGDHPRLSKVTFSSWGDEAIRAANGSERVTIGRTMYQGWLNQLDPNTVW